MRPIEKSLATILYRTLDLILPEFRRILLEFDLTETQWRVLRVLWESEPRPMAEIARASVISGPSLVGVVERLCRRGLVRRVASKADRRRVEVELTRRGQSLERRVRPLVDAAHRHLDARLSKKKWTQLFSLLEELGEKSREI